ncbi:MAG: hypothetical protein LDL33_13085, partial [Desulfomonile sp.]|nr:hypothetical protein [Desulfomonile sp.]
LRSVEFRRILGKEMDLDEIFDFLQPLPDSFCLVSQCIVNHQVNLCPFVGTEQLLDEQNKGVDVVSPIVL